MDIVLGLIIAVGAGCAAVVGSTTAQIQLTEKLLKLGDGSMYDFTVVKRQRIVRRIAVVLTVASFIAMILVLNNG